MLLTILMIVKMIPVTAFADVAPAGSSFVVGDKTYYLMDSTTTIDGKTYYGIFTKGGHAYGVNAAWTRVYSKFDFADGKTAVSGDTEVKALYGSTDIQTKASLFEPLSTYICPTDTEWEFYNGGTDRIYMKGSVGIPSWNELKNLASKGIITIPVGSGAPRSNYVITRTVTKSGSSYYMSFARSSTATSSVAFTIGGNLFAGDATGMYFMTYVSEDFFKNVKIDVATMAADVRTLLTTIYTTADMLSANIYTADELKAIGFTLTEEDLKVSSVTLKDGTSYPSITIRAGDGSPSYSRGYAFFFYKDSVELQKGVPGGAPDRYMYMGPPDAPEGTYGPAVYKDAFKMGEWNTITVGTTNEEDGVRIYLEINGEVYYDHLDNVSSIDNSGHLAFTKNGVDCIRIRPVHQKIDELKLILNSILTKLRMSSVLHRTHSFLVSEKKLTPSKVK